MLEVDNIHVNYGRLQALRGVSLSVREGEIVCVVGPNGAGKSTTLGAIAGGVTPHAGRITLRGQSLGGLPPEAVARLGVSLVPEGRHVFGSLTVAENLRIGTFQRRDRAAVAADFERILEHFPRLRERLQQPAGRLSGGEQQMLVIGRALMTRPRLVMVDEPSLGLAPKIVDQVYDILIKLRHAANLTLLINEQSSERVLKFADRIYVMRGGRIHLEDRAANLQDGKAIMQAYFGFADGTGAPPPLSPAPTMKRAAE
ncbi:branched-chain amino acid transport system ATP-binding protein [Enhydrobacter aerosaccus]|uniref:Branched-chain amino acid transport system ATP-binding protein n=1 Tax=Enhydrobacter aerosaccus TaxID=225324 RepID=A0A1T4JL03_9HYPH|nr:ABC transporter ATP-binding protein [Enhydrobacter aerosaccus]SJZ30812.1 branched-chain amino acid transport system ATP-binding protein [Enhydrobacter aerosaccus]